MGFTSSALGLPQRFILNLSTETFLLSCDDTFVQAVHSTQCEITYFTRKKPTLNYKQVGILLQGDDYFYFDDKSERFFKQIKKTWLACLS